MFFLNALNWKSIYWLVQKYLYEYIPNNSQSYSFFLNQYSVQLDYSDSI